jgi:hypothetical protein
LVCIVEDVYEREIEQLAPRALVDRDPSQGRFECCVAWEGETIERDVMTRTEKHDALDDLIRRLEQDECVRGDRPRVHVARVRHDQSLGPRVTEGIGPSRFVEIFANHTAQRVGVGRIEGARYRGWSNGRHLVTLRMREELSTSPDWGCELTASCAS